MKTTRRARTLGDVMQQDYRRRFPEGTANDATMRRVMEIAALEALAEVRRRLRKLIAAEYPNCDEDTYHFLNRVIQTTKWRSK